MSLISINYSRFDVKNGKYIYVIVDSEFGEVRVDSKYIIQASASSRAFAVVKLYGERGLPIGRNLALAVIYTSKTEAGPFAIKQLIEWQNEHCPEHIPNWAQYAKERDEHLEKLLALT